MIEIRERRDAVAAGFDDPLALLAACHDRISGHCTTLLMLREHLGTHGCDSAAQQAAARVFHYFAQAGRWHHEDEEIDLQPLLAQHGDTQLLVVMAHVFAEHHDINRAYEPLAAALQAVSTGDYGGELPVEPFVSLTRRHIAIEEERVLRPAHRLLLPDEMDRLGRAMAARRGVSPAGPSGALRDRR